MHTVHLHFFHTMKKKKKYQKAIEKLNFNIFPFIAIFQYSYNSQYIM